MSRIGKLPIPLSNQIELTIGADNMVTVKGQKGTSSLQLHPNIQLEQNDTELVVKRASDIKTDRALHGLYRSLIHNMVVGVTDGYSKKLEIIGVGFRAAITNGV